VYWNGGGSGLIQTTPIYDTQSASILTFTTTSVSAGTKYSFAVAAYNLVSTSSPSNLVQVIAATVPAQPAPVTRTASALTAITFSWDAPNTGGSPITSYIVQSNLG